MAITPTALADYAARYKPRGLDVHEERIGSYGMFTFAVNDAKNLIDTKGINAGRTAESRTVKVPVLNKEVVTINNARSLTITGNASTSAFQAVTYVTLASDITMERMSYYDNEIQYQQVLDRKLLALQNAWLEQLDQMAVDQAIVARTQFDASAGVPYTLALDILEVPNADKEEWFGEIDAIYNINNFDAATMAIVGDPRLRTVVKGIDEFAIYNSQNKALRLNGKDITFSNRVPKTGSYGAFVMLEGSLGIMNWNGKEYIDGVKETESKFKSIAFMPKLGLDVEVFHDSKFTDLTPGIPGSETSMVDHIQVSTDIAVISAYQSAPVTVASPIFQVNIT
ncbi:MAG: hypothetical protein IMY67_01820 [Bacteroidetes bacterium]|nr:hypothetical protein [Bacteroidota bacterium]